MKVVIIGASFAGVSAALATRKKHPKAEIYLIEKQQTVGYLPGGINLYFNEVIEPIEDAQFISKKQLADKNIHLLLNTKVISVDSKQHTIKCETQETESLLSFDKLILATGSSQWSQKILGSDSEKVLKYKFLPGVIQAIEQLETSDKVALIGGGQIGAEAADTLVKKGKEVHLFERMDYLLFKYFDQEMIQPVQEELEAKGVVFHFDETVEKINDTEDGLIIETKKSRLPCDSAIFAMNVRPDLGYLDEFIKTHTDQTVIVNEYLETSQADVFAIGDCIQVPYSLSNESFYIPLVNNAVRTGLVVAQNLVESTTPFVGSIRTIGTKLVDYYIASTGLTEAEGLFHEQPIAASQVEQYSSSFLGNEKITGKIIYEVDSHKILGAQLVSKANILEKINTLALGIQMGQTLEEFYQKDFLYHPYFSNVLDITNQLALGGLWSEADED
ncbi:FAD-dependent oxidoreductase [Enterococcus sp. DIV0869a]|uniref:FAD-dependent oxidoreductase n=1 Tax=Candidatus Enterococcus ikei TaxID=2815326 RepID=A0ABS3H0Y1_9ENTE|nr:FAD-dependent oxidoreductase [Enterococcus sp. DIV0869a]MBO0440813.1 FAD-dependent oxidoreductase [Enterococcus sp. DIV0869a]